MCAFLQPQRGERAEYMRLVQKNAEQNLKAYLAHQEVQESIQAQFADRTCRRARAFPNRRIASSATTSQTSRALIP